MGFKYAVVKIELTYHRINDGYQHLYLYKGDTELGHWKYNASDNSSRTEYMEVVIPIDQLANVGVLYVKYDASGAFADDWLIERMDASVRFVKIT